LNAWIGSHIHAFEYFSGVPKLLVPDNLRTGVSRACRYDTDLNPTYQEMAMHYQVGVVPARPRHPKDTHPLCSKKRRPTRTKGKGKSNPSAGGHKFMCNFLRIAPIF